MTSKVRYIITAASAVALIVVSAALFLLMREVDIQHRMVCERFPGVPVEPLVFPVKIYNGLIVLSPDTRFHLNSSMPTSMITRPTLERMKRQGMVRDSVSTFFFTRNPDGDLVPVTKIYYIDLLLHGFTFTTDLTTRNHSYMMSETPVATLRTTGFVEAPEGVPDVIGADLMGKYVMEFCYRNRSVSFFTRMPDDYDSVGVIHQNHGASELLGSGHRYYVDLTVDHVPHTYLINTGMIGVSMKQPRKNADNLGDNHRLINCVLNDDDSDKSYDVFLDPDAWVGFGNRAGTRQVYYFDNGGEDYEVSPMLFFKQDIVIDFPNKKYYLRPHYESDR